MAKITYEDKEFLNKNENIANKNKVNDTDLNQIKEVVNGNDDKIGDLSDLNTTNKDSLVEAINELNNNSYLCAELSSNQTYNGSANNTINFNHTLEENNNGFLYNNGIFTANKQMTLSISFYLNVNSSNSGQVPIVRIFKNNTQISQSGISIRAGGGNDPLTIANMIANVSEGDTLRVTIHGNGNNVILRQNSFCTIMEI